MSKIAFSDLLIIYRAARFAADGKSATVEVSNSSIRDALHFALSIENVDDSGITIEGNPDAVNVGSEVNIEVGPPKISLGYLASGFDSLLRMRQATFVEPKNYFLIAENFAKDGDNPPVTVRRYRKILEFVGLLLKCAAYLDKDRAELVFIKSGKFSIPIDYSPGELNSVDLDTVDKILSYFSVEDDSHKEQKQAILAETVLKMLEGVSPGNRFKVLLFDLPELVEKFANGYKLYLANFSYDKVRDELQAWKVDYTGKIHKAFSDIQAQLLTIPVATVVIATQLKEAKKDDNVAFLGNIAVLVGAWIFSILLVLLCNNQRRTLAVLKDEIDRQETKMKTDYESVELMFKNVFSSLRDRVRDQKIILWIVFVVLIVGLLLAHVFWWKLSKAYFGAPPKSP